MIWPELEETVGIPIPPPDDRLEKLIDALRDIAVYGRANPGYGYSCATKAIAALGGETIDV